MEINQQDIAAIAKTLETHYFQGIYEGSIDLLRQVFNKDSLLFGDVKGVPYAKTLDQYLDGVAHRTSPKDSAQTFKADILSIDVINSIAMVKLNIKMYAFNYYDFLTLHKIDGRWLIVSKAFTDVEE